MARDLVKPTAIDEFYAAHGMVQQAQRNLVSGYLQMGVALKRIRDEKLHVAAGFKNFTDYLDEKAGVSQRHAYRFIEVVEKLPKAICDRVAEMAQPISLRALTAIEFDPLGLSEDEVDELVGLSDEEFEQALVEKGYNREKMGGRGPADLKRALIDKKTYRDQRKKIVQEQEKRKAAEAERKELLERFKDTQERVDELIASVKSGDVKKLVKMNEALAARVAELEGARAEAEAEVASGREVPSAALRLVGEVTALCDRFFDKTRVDDKAGWAAVLNALDHCHAGLDDLRTRLEDVLVARINAGEIKAFDFENARAGKKQGR